MKEIRLANSPAVALIDDEDWERLSLRTWRLAPDGYVVTAICNRKVGIHRIIMNAPKGTLIDHADRNKLDNRKSNLRFCSHSLNQANSQRAPGATSKYKGVLWFKEHGFWRAMIKKDGKSIFLGYFKDEIDAALAYDRKAREIFGEFARPNFTEEYADYRASKGAK